MQETSSELHSALLQAHDGSIADVRQRGEPIREQREEQWRGRMRAFYLGNRDGILDDGTWPTIWVYHRKAKRIEPQENMGIGGGLGRTGRSAVFAMACVSGQRWLPEEKMKEDARRILVGLEEDTLRFILPLDDEHPLPAEWKIESELIDGDSLTGWLCAYWEGRYRGYW